MTANHNAPWHKASYDKFTNETLPELLAAKLPLTSYSAEPITDYTCRVTLSVATAGGELEATYEILSPDSTGVFKVDESPRVVVPLASSAHLDTAEIKCVGEQLHDLVERRMGSVALDTMPADEEFLRTLLPLDTLVRDLVTSSPGDIDTWATGQYQDTTNWLAAQTHLRRIVIKDIDDVVTPGQFGRVCPFETPEGPNIGHVFSIALGAQIRDGRLEITDNRPEMSLGLTASLVPFLEHNYPAHQSQGVNMMRQWMTPLTPEPAIVQTGNEPSVPDLWCGHNLLTAFVFWGPDTYEDGIVISESCSARLNYKAPVQSSHRLSNRHGAKGVISRILPDNDMPHLPDGTPVELVFSFSGIHKRLNLGQLREAVISRIAKAEGQPATVPVLAAPSESELKERLIQAKLPEDGMEQLTLGKNGPVLPRRSTIGWVYWGWTNPGINAGMHFATKPTDRLNGQGEMEYYAMRDVGAYANIAETYNLRSSDRSDAASLSASVAKAKLSLPEPPSPAFEQLRHRLQAAGISAELLAGSVSFRLAPIQGDKLELATALAHPWLPGRTITELGIIDTLPEFAELAETNSRLRRLLSSKAPESLKSKLQSTLEMRLTDYLSALISPNQMQRANLALFSGRATLVPALDLKLDQVGIPEEMAWGLFGPLLIREMGDAAKVETRTKEATQALDELMAKSWVIINRPPTFAPTCITAFHPVRVPGIGIRLHELACKFLNSDFDIDMAIVMLPLTDEAQHEAGQRLSAVAHLTRDHSLIKWLCPSNEAMWGLAELSRTQNGRAKIADIIGAETAAPNGYITQTTLTHSLAELLERSGPDAAIDACERLMHLGFEVCKASGASISPFAGESFAAHTDDPSGIAEVTEHIESSSDFDSADLGPQLLSVKSEARASLRHLQMLIGPYGEAKDAARKAIFVRHGFRNGLEPNELFAVLCDNRRALAQVTLECTRMGYGVRDYERPQGYGVLARAMRSQSPGLVFANAATNGETDPLTDLDSRLFVGLQV